jgi:hypothetical protein
LPTEDDEDDVDKHVRRYNMTKAAERPRQKKKGPGSKKMAHNIKIKPPKFFI